MNNCPATLIIGGSSAIGLALAKNLLKQGEQVILHYNKGNQFLLDLSSMYPDSCFVVKADLSSESEISQLFFKVDHYSDRLHKLVFCASPKVNQERLKKLQWQDFEDELNVQVRSTFQILQHYLPILAKNQWGRIVYITTSYTIGMPPAFISPYVSSKYMLNGLMKAMASEFISKGVTINGVAPSMVKTPFIDNLSDMIVEGQKNSHPMKRLAVPEEIVPLLISLLDEKSSYTTGSIIPVTGGLIAF
jgi:3-oxoacyl-[acyl-carrier protein] reductase